MRSFVLFALITAATAFSTVPDPPDPSPDPISDPPTSPPTAENWQDHPEKACINYPWNGYGSSISFDGAPPFGTGPWNVDLCKDLCLEYDCAAIEVDYWELTGTFFCRLLFEQPTTTAPWDPAEHRFTTSYGCHINLAHDGAPRPMQLCLYPREGTFFEECGLGDERVLYRFSVPEGCMTGGCGLILDIPGMTMSAATEDAATNMAALGNAANYIVITAQAPNLFWSPATHGPIITNYIRSVLAAYDVDETRVHAMGFSMGGYSTWALLCLAPDLFCSVSPNDSSGLDQWNNPPLWVGFNGDGNCFIDDGPAPARSVLYYSGRKSNNLSNSSLADEQAANVMRAYNFSDGEEESHSTYKRSVYGSAEIGPTFVLVEHNYTAAAGTPFESGHCIPRPGLPSPRPHVCTDGYTGEPEDLDYGQEALDFFQANPCR